MPEVILDVVGATEARQILSVELQRISRWRKQGRLVTPYVQLGLGPVWVRDDVVRAKGFSGPYAPVPDQFNGSDGAWRKALQAWCSEFGFTMPPVEPPLLGTAEAAGLLTVDKSQIARWRNRPTKSGPAFPEPAVKIVAGPLWTRTAIQKFASQRAAK